MSRALVTGATGLLGRQMVTVLLEAGVRVRALVRPSSDVSLLAGKPVELIRGEAGDSSALPEALDDVDWLFHLAGHLTVSAPFGAGGDSPHYQAVNVDWTKALLQTAATAGIGRFLYASSSSVYDLHAPSPVVETAPLRPSSDYGQSKLAAEQQIGAYQVGGLATTIVRPAVIYGPGDRYFTPTALRLANLPLLPLVAGGNHQFDLIYARDVAELLWRAAQSEAAVGRIYNAAPAEPTSLAELVAEYRRLIGRGPRIVPISAAAARRFAPLSRPLLARLVPGAEAALSSAGIDLMSRDIHLDMSRAAAELGYRPRFSLAQGLAETLHWFGYEQRPLPSPPQPQEGEQLEHKRADK